MRVIVWAMSPRNILETLVNEVSAGRVAALCAIVATRGSTPQPAGTIVCVDSTALMTGSLGGGCMEADVRRSAHQLLADRKSEVLTFSLDNDFGHDDGMICGGELDIAVQTISDPSELPPFRTAVDQLRAGREAVLPIRVTGPAGMAEYRLTIETVPRLVIAGAGHISRFLATTAVTCGFDVSIVDERGDLNNARRFPPPIKTVVGDIGKTLADRPIDAATYVVIVTRGHKHDEQALAAVIHSPACYIGMIGSKRKIDVTFDDLRHGGVSDERLARVHAPIGLDIGAVTAEEIAVSIAAQLVAERRKNHHAAVSGPFPVARDTT